ncbi:hypothetical protein EDC96DRAFT_524215 [Choanephora cucurbitarum]|nr:hypothetical protein EDC96DRAFT_524215 [Choanephora cucurbitarum]
MLVSAGPLDTLIIFGFSFHSIMSWLISFADHSILESLFFLSYASCLLTSSLLSHPALYHVIRVVYCPTDSVDFNISRIW